MPWMIRPRASDAGVPQLPVVLLLRRSNDFKPIDYPSTDTSPIPCTDENILRICTVPIPGMALGADWEMRKLGGLCGLFGRHCGLVATAARTTFLALLLLLLLLMLAGGAQAA